MFSLNFKSLEMQSRKNNKKQKRFNYLQKSHSRDTGRGAKQIEAKISKRLVTVAPKLLSPPHHFMLARPWMDLRSLPGKWMGRLTSPVGKAQVKGRVKGCQVDQRVTRHPWGRRAGRGAGGHSFAPRKMKLHVSFYCLSRWWVCTSFFFFRLLLLPPLFIVRVFLRYLLCVGVWYWL